MSTVRQTLIENGNTACKKCFSRQLELIATAHRLSSEVRDRNAMLYIQIQRIAQLDPFPNIASDKSEEITTICTAVDNTTTEEELDAQQIKLIKLFESIGPPADDKVSTTGSSNLLNKRMMDLLHVMKDNIRTARRRLNDAGGGYDQDAYKAVRNQTYLTQHVYLEQLDNDLVFATIDDCAQIEQVRYPAILNADAASFVDSIQALLDFLKERVLAAQVA